jgi:hypothetical protein
MERSHHGEEESDSQAKGPEGETGQVEESEVDACQVEQGKVIPVEVEQGKGWSAEVETEARQLDQGAQERLIGSDHDAGEARRDEGARGSSGRCGAGDGAAARGSGGAAQPLHETVGPPAS